jgi:prolyl-tRNA synthetase
MNKTAITPTRSEDYPEWYQQVVKAADLAETSVVRGCMVIKPNGYAIWENMQAILDKKIKETGHKNFYCPMFIPLSFIEKEAEHVEGFAKECAVVTHHKLSKDPNGGLKPDGKLEEPLIIRPTSEVIIGELYAKWINSYRDLPLLYNQWANVVRWEMRTRVFLRTTEFLWQEGHTAHANAEEAIIETKLMLEIYVNFLKEYLAVPVIFGEKTKTEKFPGAVQTHTLEAMMQDKKALQCGTSHYLGQNFAQAFNIKFLDSDGIEKLVHTTSWGVTTRMIGCLIMVHSDDNGLVLPPKIAPVHIVIMPIEKNGQDADNAAILAYAKMVQQKLSTIIFNHKPVVVELDLSNKRTGEKAWGHVKKGTPIRIEIGKKELDENKLYVARRDHEYNDKQTYELADFTHKLPDILEQMQQHMFDKAHKFMNQNTFHVESKEEFYNLFKQDAGFVLAPWNDEPESEAMIKNDLKVTPRCIPHHLLDQKGTCIFTGKKDCSYTLFAKSY